MTARRFAAGCGIVLVTLLLLAGCGIAVTISSLPSGDLPDVDFRGDEISRARAEVAPALEAELDGVEARFGARHVGPRLRRDRCEAGEDNFTRQDRYAFTCTMQIAQLMPVREPFEADASRLGEALVEGDCPDGTDTDRALAEPVDHPGQLDSSTGDCAPARGFGPQIRRWLSAPPTADEVELAEIYLRSRCRPGSTRREYCDSDPLDLRAVAAAVPPAASHLAVVVADELYFEVPWNCPWPASWLRESCRG